MTGTGGGGSQSGGLSGSPAELSTARTLGRPIRSGPATQLGVPTDELVIAALRRGQLEEAVDLFGYLVEEAGRIHWLLSTWLDSMRQYAEANLPGYREEVAALESRIGAPMPIVDPAQVATREQSAVRTQLDASNVEEASVALRSLRSAQMAVHDAQVDWLWGLLTALQEAFGEARMDEVFRTTQGRWLSERYEQVKNMTPREVFELSIEGMRGHYCGSGRSGDIKVEEDDEKWVMSFDPCGTGGRMRRGDPERDQAPRTGSPFGFANVAGAHDWTWGRKGVCLYCAHCAVVNEILPIEQLGTPMRVTQYPESPSDACTWTVYKSPELVPDWAFERVGKRRPAIDVEPGE